MSTATFSETKRLFALVDVNNMDVSRERVFNPCLQGKHWFKLKDLARKHGILTSGSNYTLYGDMSNRIMTVLRDYSRDIEVCSIDESFLTLKAWAACWHALLPRGSGHASVCGGGWGACMRRYRAD
jgi:DNA polymerase V